MSEAIKIRGNILKVFLVSIHFAVFLIVGPNSYAASCAIGSSEGSWNQVRYRTWDYYDRNPWPADYSCDLQGKGVLTSQSGTGHTFELISGELKAIELINACQDQYGVCDSSFKDCRACAGYVNGSSSCRKTVEVGCLATVQDLSNQCLEGTTGPVNCRGYTPRQCGNGTMYVSWTGSFNDCSAGARCYSPAVVRRILNQWVCNNCVSAYSALKTKCGGSNNIAYFNNESCSGKCKIEFSNFNNGPPCDPKENCCQ